MAELPPHNPHTQLDRRGGGIGRRRIVLPAGSGDGKAQPRPDARPAGEHGVAQGGQQFRGAAGVVAPVQGQGQRTLDPRHDVH